MAAQFSASVLLRRQTCLERFHPIRKLNQIELARSFDKSETRIRRQTHLKHNGKYFNKCQSAAYLLLLLFVVSASAEQRVTADLPDFLKRQADAWDVAIIKKDRQAIAANMAESFMQIDTEGGTADKAQFVAGIIAKDLTISPYSVEDFKIRIYADI